MPLDNYTDLSVGGSDVNTGFQFEFRCEHCSQKWKSPFKPYRVGQITGVLMRFAFLLPGMNNYGRAGVNVSEIGSRGAKESALAEARQRAATLYTVCGKCKKAACEDCFDTNQNLCVNCIRASKDASKLAGQAESGAGVTRCPNCQQPHEGGRFCAECGFDLASTHKSCPGCSALLARNARFCTDCGHGF